MDFGQAYDGLRRSYEQGVAMANADWVAALFAEDAVLLAPGNDPIAGREGIRAHLQEFLSAFKIEVAIEVADSQEIGEKGCGYGTFKMTLSAKDGGSTEVTGKYLNVVQPREDKTLEIVRHCWNADQPLPQP